MANYLFQSRGPAYLQELDADLNLVGAAFQICLDTIAIDTKTESWEHINKCGPVDVADGRGINTVGMDLSISFADAKDRIFALSALGTVNAAADSPSAVVDEALPSNQVAGGYFFLGGKERHRAITALVLTDGGASPPAPLVLNTDYTLDAATGMGAWLTTPAGAVTASYSHTDPASVSMLSAAQKEYALNMEYIDKQHSNKKGSLEIYRVRFDPVTGLNFLPDKNQDFALKGSGLADTSRDVTDTEFGQFGRRVL